MNDAVRFDLIIDKLVKKARNNVVAITVVTAIIEHLDSATEMKVALTMIIGKNVALLTSPLVPATFLAIGLADVELKDHIRLSFAWLFTNFNIRNIAYAAVINTTNYLV